MAIAIPHPICIFLKVKFCHKLGNSDASIQRRSISSEDETDNIPAPQLDLCQETLNEWRDLVNQDPENQLCNCRMRNYPHINCQTLLLLIFEELLECRSVKPGEEKCFIPQKIWDKSVEQIQPLGYVVIQLDEPYLAGEILGYIRSLSVSELPLSYLQPLDDLIDRLIPPISETVRLGEWLQDLSQVFTQGWKPLQELLEPKPPVIAMAYRSPITAETTLAAVRNLYLKANLAIPINLESEKALLCLLQSSLNDEIRWQAAELIWKINPQPPDCPIINGKDLGLYLNGCQVALIVGILPKSDGKRLILLRLYPLQESHLPPKLKLIGFDETGSTLFEIESRQKDDYMQFKLTADEGDCFSIQVMFDRATFTESFVI
jgi:hypothetical protein